jgi:hypothetical protein
MNLVVFFFTLFGTVNVDLMKEAFVGKMYVIVTAKPVNYNRLQRWWM